MQSEFGVSARVALQLKLQKLFEVEIHVKDIFGEIPITPYHVLILYHFLNVQRANESKCPCNEDEVEEILLSQGLWLQIDCSANKRRSECHEHNSVALSFIDDVNIFWVCVFKGILYIVSKKFNLLV